jgi:hypothetical protein
VLPVPPMSSSILNHIKCGFFVAHVPKYPCGTLAQYFSFMLSWRVLTPCLASNLEGCTVFQYSSYPQPEDASHHADSGLFNIISNACHHSVQIFLHINICLLMKCPKTLCRSAHCNFSSYLKNMWSEVLGNGQE